MPKHYRPPGKKKEGNAAKYMTRSQAVKYLQVSLSVFRKLCILKGVFPREPKKKVKGGHQTYYHVKDIMFLKHEPILEKLREMRAYEKKVKKAMSKKNRDLAERLLSRKPTYTLDMLIRERYPRFVDALGDLDDCLSMIHLFAALPAIDREREKIEVNRIHNCRRLSHEWQAYISRTHKLRKTFISVKGIYYQAEVEGQKITWLSPHALQQVLPDDVDYNIMLTFLEFYETLLAFVNFKLYHSINIKYPPILDPRLEALAADLYALSRYFDANSRASEMELKLASVENGAKSKDAELEESELRLAQLQHQLPSNEPGALMHLMEDAEGKDEDDAETMECRNLFKNMKFFLGREVPRESLLFVIPAFGGVVSWEGEGAPFEESDQSITYQIVDRPTQGRKFLSRDYVQPQWVYDCINARIILPTDDYMVGRVPPPHLSPFVDNEKEGYIPEYAPKFASHPKLQTHKTMALIFNTELFAASLSVRIRSSLPFFNSPAAAVSKLPAKRTTVAFCSVKAADNRNGENEESNSKTSERRKLSKQSSWEAKDDEGNDYLYVLGKESDNMNIAVGARAGVIDDLFAGNFLGKDSDIVFDYRQKVTRSFEYLQGDYYIAPLFMDKVVTHIVKNFIVHLLNAKVPLILGIWGGKGQGKTFQTELIFRALGVEPVIMSAGELESERAGEPGKLIRERYRTASRVVQNQGKMSCLMINDIDAGLGRFGNTQMTVNNQIVVGTLMNLSDNPTRVSIGQDWRESDITHRVPVIVTGNDFSKIYAPLIRDGRMEKFYWQPTFEDILNIVHRMYEKDGITRDEVAKIVSTFPNQALDFYGALRSRTYDRSILKWVEESGGIDNIGRRLLKQRKEGKLPVFTPPKQTLEALLESGHSLVNEQKLIMETKLSKEYMKNID